MARRTVALCAGLLPALFVAAAGTLSQGCGGKKGGNGFFAPVTSLTVTTTALPNGTVGAVYSQQVLSAGGTAPVTWSISAGALPSGLNLDTNTGTIAGTPTAAGTFPFTVRAMDAAGQSDDQQLSITVGAGTGGVSEFPVTVGAGTTPTYTWADNGGQASSLTVARVANPGAPVWAISTPGQNGIDSPVTHGTVPGGATNTVDVEPVLTPGVAYRARVTQLSGRTGFVDFTP